MKDSVPGHQQPMRLAPGQPDDPARRPLPPGPCLTLKKGALEVVVAPQAGGRLRQVRHGGQPWLLEQDRAAVAWGCYPMVPWAGRLREGRLTFQGQHYRLPPTLGRHAIHGVGYLLPWQVEQAGPAHCMLALALPEDAHWPFGGQAWQQVQVEQDALHLQLSVRAGSRPMPLPVLGWHPWFHKPDALHFQPRAMYPRDAAGIAILPVQPPTPSPWDDCFIHQAPVVLERAGTRLQLSSDCDHWVVFDERPQATCVEPQSGPPDAFNLFPERVLAPGQSVQMSMVWHWS